MNKKEVRFVEVVLAFYHAQGRHFLPWRKTRDPYKILVSEVMLQQTQVDRVLPKYAAFLTRFPNITALAEAPLRDVLLLWQGLGYNRRAKMLHACAKSVVALHNGTFPKNYAELVTLPGVGPYTASAVLAFAFNIPSPLIETNVRTVYLHHFFKGADSVTDTEILARVKRTLPQEDVRTWYWALMDYGSYIKKTHGNPNTQSKHYTRQTPFKGSDREIRGALIRLLTKKAHTRAELQTALAFFEDIRVDALLYKLIEEGMIIKKRHQYFLP